MVTVCLAMLTVGLHGYVCPDTYTVKSLYSEQSRDPKKCSLYGGVHPRGVRYVHAHMCLKYNVHILKLFRPCLRDSLGGRAIFHEFLFIFYDFLYTGVLCNCILIVYHSSSTHSSRLTSQISLNFESLISLNFSSKFKFSVLLTCLPRQTRCAHYHCNLQTDCNLAILLRHCSHDWDTNNTLSTWYSVKCMGI